MSEPLLTADEVAVRWATTRARVHALARGGSLVYVDISPRVRRFREADVHDFEEMRRSYTPSGGEAEDTRQRRGLGVQRTRPKAAVGGKHRRGVDPGGSPDPAGPLRIVRAGG